MLHPLPPNQSLRRRNKYNYAVNGIGCTVGFYLLNADNGLEVNVASGGFYIPVGCYTLHFYWWALSPLDNLLTPDGLFVRRASQSGVVKCLRDISVFLSILHLST